MRTPRAPSRFVVLLVAASATLALPARAQTPYAAIYFDDGWSLDDWAVCPYAPPGTVLQTLSVYVHNVNSLIIAVEFSVEMPPELFYLGTATSADVVIGDAVVGTPPDNVPGAAFAWRYPQKAFEPFLVGHVFTVWMCDDCTSVGTKGVWVRPHGQTGWLSVVRWPAIDVLLLEGRDAVVCPGYQPAVESTTWGAVKALYGKDVP